jgi:hypothetical protein
MRLLKQTVVILLCCVWFASSLPAQEKFTTPLIPREVLFGNQNLRESYFFRSG